MTDLFYIGRRLVGRVKAWEGVRVCLDQLHIIAVGTAELAHAASLSGDDFEDNLQLACAITLSLQESASDRELVSLPPRRPEPNPPAVTAVEPGTY